jgi:hypothetical protein
MGQYVIKDVCKGNWLFTVALTLSVVALYDLYLYFSTGYLINESLRQRYVTGWAPGILEFAIFIITLSTISLIYNVTKGNQTLKIKVGCSLLVLSVGLFIVQQCILLINGAREPLQSRLFVPLLCIILLILFLGIVLTRPKTGWKQTNV